jgi:hypothetical protein
MSPPKGEQTMAQRKLKVLDTIVSECNVKIDEKPCTVTRVAIVFSRKLSALEISGVRAVLDGEIK